MNRRILLLPWTTICMGAALLTGCASTNQLVPVASGPIPANSARIVVSRGGGFVGSAAPIGIIDSGKQIGAVGIDGQISWDRIAGTMDLVGFNTLSPPDAERAKPLRVCVGAGMIYQFRVSWPTFSFERFPNIELVSGTPVACKQNETRSAEGHSPVPPKDPAAEAAFQEEARKYRDMPAKPVLPEEARKYAVQGDFAVEKKNLAAAEARYADALKVAPWWPEGHFKRGRVLADMERYGEAVEEMKKFLLLTPEAKEARDAQDNIYKWESAGTLTASGGASRSVSASGQASAAAADGVMTFTGKIESFPMGPFQFRSGPPLWPSGMIVVATENGEKRNFLIVGSGARATIFYDADGTARGNLASGNARVTVGKKVEVKYVSAPANYVTKALAVSVRYLE
jgi:hypothetical protein